MNLFETLGIAAIFSGALVLIIRKLIEQFFSKDLEKFKAELEKEIIKHKTRLRRCTQSAPIAGEPSEEEKTKILAEIFNGLSNYYVENRLFFNEKLAQEIDGLLKKFMDTWHQWGYANDLRRTGEPNVREWGKAWGQVKDEIPPIQQSIEMKF